jgi:F0F1-type ATP synthase assembly protein I
MDTGEQHRMEFDELLAAEFHYIAQTAIQAHEDRARVSSFYLIAVGSLVAALFGTQYIDSNMLALDLNILFSALFGLLTFLGTSTVMQLARLRAAWYESALAMNELKDYVVGENASLAKAFRWKTSTLPPKYKKDSVSYYQAREVALISGVMFGAAVLFLQRTFVSTGSVQLVIATLMGAAAMALQLHLYRQILR